MAPVLYDKKPELGDLIEIHRGIFRHWAVYVGDGFVVHLASARGGKSSSLLSLLIEGAIVKKEKLMDVVGNDKWVINNGLDKKYEPHLSHFIIKEACALVGQERPYCIFRKNCEHFVNKLRYGKAESGQVRQGIAWIAAWGCVLAVVLITVSVKCLLRC